MVTRKLRIAVIFVYSGKFKNHVILDLSSEVLHVQY